MEVRQLLSATLVPQFVGYSSNPNVPVSSRIDVKTLGTSGPSGLTPIKIRTAYGLGTYGASNVTFNGIQGDGTGQTIALIDALNAPSIVADLTAFDSYYSLPNPPSFQVLNETGGTIANQTATTGTTPGPSGSSGDSIESALDVDWAHVMAPKASIILYEANSLSDNDLFTAALTAAKNPNVTVASMSFGGGEPGGTLQTTYDHDFNSSSGVGITFLASTGDTGAAVEYPSESYNVVAVGGTTLTLSGNNYSSEKAWTSGGGGTSTVEAQPGYQKQTLPAATKRENPDVSIDADPNSGVPIYDSYDEGSGTPWAQYGGTSLSSPLWAGIIAVADQGRVAEGDTGMASSLTTAQTLTRLYQLSKANFHDITTGSNGHAAVAGYDEATGIGTPIANVLIPDLAGAGTVTGTIFSDNNGNGVYDAGDAPLAGQTVYLDLNNNGAFDSNTSVSEPTATTNAQGVYTFTDQPAGGNVVLSNPTIAGYVATSASSVTFGYGATDTVNFTYASAAATKVAFTQQPASTPYGSVISPFTVTVESSAGTTVTNDSSTVTLTLSSGTFSTGLTTASVPAVNGVATFSNLQVSNAGSYTFTASDGTLTSAVSTSFPITQVTPTISWPFPSPISYGTPLDGTELNATASVPGTFAYTPAAGTVLTAGTNPLSVVFTPTDSVDYTTANASVTISVSKAAPVITWAAPAPITYGAALDSTELDATASVAGTFRFSPVSGTVLGAGAGQTLKVFFTPTDTTDYSSTSATTTLTVLQATPTVSWTPPASISYGTALSGTQLDATANVPGAFVYTPASGTVLNAGAGQTLSAVFTPTDSTDYTTSNGSATLTVLQAAPIVSWTPPASITYGTALSGSQLDATASVPGAFAYTPASGTILHAGAGQTLSAVFTPTDSTDYSTANGSTTLTVLQATPIVSWTPPASITYGTALSGTQLDATASVPGAFVYTPASGTVLNAGAGQTLSAVFTPTDSTDYTTANGSTTLTVSQATPVITWANPASIAYPTPLSGTQLDATANVPGTFVYTPSAGTVLNPGPGQTLGVAFTPTDSTDYTTASASALITVTGTLQQSINLTGPTFYLKLDNASPQNLDIWTNSTGTGTPAEVKEFDTISSVTLTATTAGDSFTADFSNGTVVPGGGLTFNGFGSAASNTLTVVGTGGSDSVIVPGDGTVHLNDQTVNYSNAQIGNIYFQPSGTLGSLTVPSGTVTLAPGSSTGITTDDLSSISIALGATLIVPVAPSHSSRLLIDTGALNLTGSETGWTSTVDLNNNDLDVANGSLANLNSQVAQGYSTGSGGIISSAAQNDSTYLTTLGVIQNSIDGTITGAPLYGTSAPLGLFDGANPASTDVLVKYTYYGDANLDGTVDGSDYSRIDAAYGTPATGWFNGDFNHDGNVDGSDYTLIDNAYNSQGASQAAEIATIAPVASPTTAASSLFSDTSISDQGIDQAKKRRNLAVVAIGLTGEQN